MLQIPEVVRRKALAVGADEWLEDLPELVASVEQEWGRQMLAAADRFALLV